tara:strand:+ start:5371 stop:7461 length:2091 start_codon:yes stop_codon:yes gene_type:complete
MVNWVNQMAEQKSKNEIWFNRMVEHWTLPGPDERDRFLDHVRLARIQVVQSGNFGPFFYGLGDDPEAERYWVGMPLVGVRENLDYAEELIQDIQETGALVVGQISLTWHYANHRLGLGLFGSWDRVWREGILGEAPCGPEDGHQLLADGSIRSWDITGRPYQTYSGCMCNPNWLSVLKPMVKKAIDLGVDGLNAHHNFESFCTCNHCRSHLLPSLSQAFGNKQLRDILGGSPEEVIDFTKPREDCPEPLKEQFAIEITRAANRRRKAFFDELIIDYGRSLKPDLKVAQWYHKYDFNAQDERSMLPENVWAKEEDYIWYSQGPYRWLSAIKEGFIGDMGMPARYVHAMGHGKPFIIMKYDYKRWRLWIGEAAAHQGASYAFHAGPPGGETEPGIGRSSDDYYGPVNRYQQFLSNYESLFDSVNSWSQIGLVYPRRAELEGRIDATLPLKRIGRILEDHHFTFNILLDHLLSESIDAYELLVLPEVERLSIDEMENLHRWVTNGGSLFFTGKSGLFDPEGKAHPKDSLGVFSDCDNHGGIARSHGKGQYKYLPDGPWAPNSFVVGETPVPTYPIVSDDTFSQSVANDIRQLVTRQWLETDAPWYVRVRPWLSDDRSKLIVHWINYLQDEDACVEVPIPTGPITVKCLPPSEAGIERVEWIYPEMKEPTDLVHSTQESATRFTIPNLIVYGISILHLKK